MRSAPPGVERAGVPSKMRSFDSLTNRSVPRQGFLAQWPAGFRGWGALHHHSYYPTVQPSKCICEIWRLMAAVAVAVDVGGRAAAADYSISSR